MPFEPTPHHVVAEMLKLAQVGAKDLVYDLGCGDGRIVIAAAKQAGARGVCVDIDPRRIRESRANAQRTGVEGRITFLTQNFFETDVGDATVVTLFLWPEVNLKLCPKLWRELKPGTRVVSYVHSMDGVNGASVSLKDKKARIVFAPGEKPDVDKIKKTITDAGFTPGKATVRTEETQ